MKLTQRAVDALQPGERRIVWDETVPRFGVRITLGSISYIVDLLVGRKRRRVVLDSVSRIALGAARARAQEILIGARRGEDLTVHLLNPTRGASTFAEVWRAMIDGVDKPKLSPATIDDYEDRAKRLIQPRLRHGLIGESDDGRALNKIVSPRPRALENRAYVVVLIKKTINLAQAARGSCPMATATRRTM